MWFFYRRETFSPRNYRSLEFYSSCHCATVCRSAVVVRTTSFPTSWWTRSTAVWSRSCRSSSSRRWTSWLVGGCVALARWRWGCSASVPRRADCGSSSPASSSSSPPPSLVSTTPFLLALMLNKAKALRFRPRPRPKFWPSDRSRRHNSGLEAEPRRLVWRPRLRRRPNPREQDQDQD